MRKPRTALMTIAAATAAVTLSIGGAALAASGLPGAADDGATSAVPSSAQVSVPGPAEAASTHPADRGRSVEQTGDDETTETSTEATEEPEARQDTHGSQVSELARTTTLTGSEKGAEISKLASEGKARAHAPEQTEAEHPGDLPAAATDRGETGVQQRAAHAPGDDAASTDDSVDGDD